MVSGKVTCRAGLGLFKTAPAQKASKLGDLSLGLELLVLWGLSLLLSHLCSEAARAGLLAAADPPPTGAALLRLCFSHGGGWRFPGLQASSGWHCGLPEEQEWEPSSPAALSLPGAEGGLGVFSRSPAAYPWPSAALGSWQVWHSGGWDKLPGQGWLQMLLRAVQGQKLCAAGRALFSRDSWSFPGSEQPQPQLFAFTQSQGLGRGL